MNQYAQIFESVRFQAPEGEVRPEVKSATSDGDRVSLLLWFYDGSGKPLNDNLTVSISESATEGQTGYREAVVDAVQRWLSGVRDGEPLQVLP